MSPNPQWAFVHRCSISQLLPYLQTMKGEVVLPVAEADERDLLTLCTNSQRAICVLVSINDAFYGRPQGAVNLLLGTPNSKLPVLHFFFYSILEKQRKVCKI